MDIIYHNGRQACREFRRRRRAVRWQAIREQACAVAGMVLIPAIGICLAVLAVIGLLMLQEAFL